MKAREPAASTLYQRRYRERMREAGLVKKDVWILPEHAQRLADVERQLRLPAGVVEVTEAARQWRLTDIANALQEQADAHGLSVQVLQGADTSLQVLLHRHGDLPVYVACDGAQMLVEAYLWPIWYVRDEAAFNRQVLAMHKLMPLSSVALEDVGEVPSYIMFGALDAQSSLQSLLFEIETLGGNVISFTEACLSALAPEYANA